MQVQLVGEVLISRDLILDFLLYTTLKYFLGKEKYRSVVTGIKYKISNTAITSGLLRRQLSGYLYLEDYNQLGHTEPQVISLAVNN